MKKIETGAPLTYIEDLNTDRLSWRVNLPEFVPTGRIHLNVQRLNKFAALAGFKHLDVYSETGEISSNQMVVDQIDASGMATAAANHGHYLHKAALSEIDVAFDQDQVFNRFTDFVWNDGVIKVNSSEIGYQANRLAKNSQDIRSPHLWGMLLNEAIADGIYQAAKENLLGESVSYFNKAAFYGTLGELGIIAGVNQMLTHNLGSLLLYGAGIAELNQAVFTSLGWVSGNSIRHRRWSAVPGYQIDRVLMAKVLPKILPTIKIV